MMGAEGLGTEAMKVATAEMEGTGEARAVVRAVAWAAGTAAAGTAAVRVAAMGAAAMVREVVDSAAAAVDETVVLVARAAVVRGAVVRGAVEGGAVGGGNVRRITPVAAVVAVAVGRWRGGRWTWWWAWWRRRGGSKDHGLRHRGIRPRVGNLEHRQLGDGCECGRW